MESIFIDTEQGIVHVLKFGAGPKLLIALHGFGDRAALFLPLEPVLAPHFTVLAVDLPFHGQTEWRKRTFSGADLMDHIIQLKKREGKLTCSIMGFSFGARLALGLLTRQDMPFEHLYLLSPDGIRTKGMRLAERTPQWMRKILYALLHRPGWLLEMINTLAKTGLVPDRSLQFVQRHLSRPHRIRRSFGCWLSLNDFRIERSQIRQKLAETALPVDIFIGAEDTLLDPAVFRRYFAELPAVRIHVLAGEGHAVIGTALQNEFKLTC